MESTKVNVSIYGHDYTIIGEKSPEYIGRVAAHVDSRMNEIAEGMKGGPVSKLAVLSAINITDEMFDLQEKIAELERTNEKMENEIQHYVQLWEDAKRSLVSYKEDSQSEIQNLTQQKDEMVNLLNEKDKEIDELKRNREKVEQDAQKGSAEVVQAANKKYKELENNYFDLQMEDIQLKSEIEKLKQQLRDKNESQNL